MTQRQMEIVDHVGFQPISVAEFRKTYYYTCPLSTISRTLATAHKEGLLDRRWEGNDRVGRYVYWQK